MSHGLSLAARCGAALAVALSLGACTATSVPNSASLAPHEWDHGPPWGPLDQPWVAPAATYAGPLYGYPYDGWYGPGWYGPGWYGGGAVLGFGLGGYRSWGWHGPWRGGWHGGWHRGGWHGGGSRGSGGRSGGGGHGHH
ncbi:MAG TPA: hypothetical protein VE684_18135 [Crenalkalicoccus sp.]|jgi:hypothetical protein|nr:hypothetical protein [Crenalkalicoccus sp.]